jgi:glycosyltransferase involved in cell wall biosynthesis
VSGVFIREHARAVSLFHDVVVVYSEGITPSLEKAYEIKDSIEDGLRTLRLYYRKPLLPKTAYFVYLWGMFRVFRQLTREGYRPDIIHAHIYSAGVPAVLLGRAFKIPVVVSEHFSGFSLGTMQGLELMKARFVFNHADLVCPVSEDLRKRLESYKVKASFCVVPNAVDTSLFYPRKRSSVIRGDKKKILLVALLDSKKGVACLLEALARLRKVRDDFFLDIVGDGPYRTEYEKLSCKLELSDVVFFHGLKLKEEIAELMRQSDFLVLPSQYETFGVVLVEAMACGKPVIGADAGGPREIIKEELGKLFSPGDFKDLASTIDYMLDHYQDYSSKEIARYARECYGYNFVGKKLDEVYKFLVSEGGN